MTTGAEALVTTLADCGVSVCFANPGTSEMHLVQALDREPRIRSVLCLFEGVATGAADGYARVAGHPAMTLLHLGPGYSNAAANIHNARKAFSPMINVVGEHATYHRALNAPLASDIETLVAPTSVWTGIAETAQDAGATAAETWQKSQEMPGPVALILPADSAWDEGGEPVATPIIAKPEVVTPQLIVDVAEAIQNAAKPVLLVNGHVLATSEGIALLGRLNGYGVRVITDTSPPKQKRGVGHFAPSQMQYFAEHAEIDLAGVDLLVLAGTQEPVAFFAYPDRPSMLTPDGAKVMTLASRLQDSVGALEALAEMLAAATGTATSVQQTPPAPTGQLTTATAATSLARHMPASSIVCDEAITAGAAQFAATHNSREHLWLRQTGGAIGLALPMAIGAAIADPQAKVIALSGDGSAMYTLQALWTMAREQLPVVSIIFANRSYRILNIEMERTGAGAPGPAATAMLSLDNPVIDWVKLAEGQGVRGIRCETAEDFDAALEAAVAASEPVLIEAVIPA
jgi:acetolactate synthase I/II/III large subunit